MNSETKKKSNIRILWDFLKGSKLLFFIAILSAAVMSLCDMLTPQIIRSAIDNALGGKEADFPPFVMKIVDYFGGFEYLGEHLIIMSAAVMVVALVRALAQYVHTVSNTKGAETLSKTMRDTLFQHISRLPYEWHMQNHTGDIIQRCTSDVQTVRNFIAEQLTALLLLLTKIVMGFYFMISMNGKLTLIAVIPMPFIILYVFIFSKQMKKGFAKCDQTEGIVSAMVQENLTGVRVVRAFGQEAKEKRKFEAENEYYTGLWVDMGKHMGQFWSAQDLLIGLQTLLVLIFGAVFCINDKMLPGEYVAFLSYNAMLSTPIRRVGRVISEMSKAGVAIDRIAYIINSEEEHDKEDAIEVPMNQDIEFSHVSFGYSEGVEVLSDVSFKIPAGTTLGILGGTGSGKSTLMLLLDKMYDVPSGCGKITIGGTDIKDIKMSYLRDNISMVLQEPYLYSRSLLENIKITDSDLTLDQVKDAARSACLDDTIESFSKGYDTFVGERGVTLSGGQKQRAAIARALTKNAPILVFDDSLSAVDTETDAKIRKSLEERFGTATIIIISHRITTLSKADQVLVLENGKVSEIGTPDELKTSGGLYNQIYAIQSGSIDGKEAQENEN